MVFLENEIIDKIKNKENFGLITGNGISHTKLYDGLRISGYGAKRRSELLEIMRFKSQNFLPPLEYLYIYFLLREKVVPLIITTNFDTYLNKVLKFLFKRHGVSFVQEPRDKYKNEKFIKKEEDNNYDLKLYKLHGDIRYIYYRESTEFDLIPLPNFTVYSPDIYEIELFSLPYPQLNNSKISYYPVYSSRYINLEKRRNCIGWEHHIRERLTDSKADFRREYELVKEDLKEIENILILGWGGASEYGEEDLLPFLNDIGKEKDIYFTIRTKKDKERRRYNYLKKKFKEIKYLDLKYYGHSHCPLLKNMLNRGIDITPNELLDTFLRWCRSNDWPLIYKKEYEEIKKISSEFEIGSIATKCKLGEIHSAIMRCSLESKDKLSKNEFKKV